MRKINVQTQDLGNLMLLAMALMPVVEPYNALFYPICGVVILCFIILCFFIVRDFRNLKKDKTKESLLGKDFNIYTLPIMASGLIICYATDWHSFGKVWIFLIVLELINLGLEFIPLKKKGSGS